MVLDFILRRPHAPFRCRIETPPVSELLIPHALIPLQLGLVERIVMTNEDELPEPVEGEAPPRVRTWKAIRWELQLLPRRQWWLQLREITKIPGEIVGNRPELR